ncbi:MAG: hypothetical protein QM660_10930 [Dysgonomonas sp.]
MELIKKVEYKGFSIELVGGGRDTETDWYEEYAKIFKGSIYLFRCYDIDNAKQTIDNL